MTEGDPGGKGPRRVDPSFGVPVFKVIDTLQRNPAVVDATVGAKLHYGGKHESLGIVRSRVRQRIDLERAQEIAPSWLRIDGLIRIANNLMEPDMWREWAHTTQALTESESVMSGRTDLEEESGATLLTFTNAQFYTSAVSLGLLATATGEQIINCLPANQIDSNFSHAAIAIGARFETPAKNLDRYVDRVKILIPDPAMTQRIEEVDREGGRIEDPMTLYDFLSTYDAFTRESTGNHCPAKLLTLQMFDEWGRRLAHDEDYIERFKKTISKRNHSNP